MGAVSIVRLDLGSRSFVVEADQIISFSPAGSEFESSVDLGEFLGEGPKDAARNLIVHNGERWVSLTVCASLRLDEVDREAFFRLPRLLGPHCLPWVRGLVLVDQTLAVWIDLRSLSSRCGS